MADVEMTYYPKQIVEALREAGHGHLADVCESEWEGVETISEALTIERSPDSLQTQYDHMSRALERYEALPGRAAGIEASRLRKALNKLWAQMEAEKA